MKNNLLFISLLIIFGACNSKFYLQKRRYTKGFYFSSNFHKHKIDKQNEKVHLINKVAEKAAETGKRIEKSDEFVSESIKKNQALIAKDDISMSSHESVNDSRVENRKQKKNILYTRNHTKFNHKDLINKVKKTLPDELGVIFMMGVILMMLAMLIKWIFEDKPFQKILALALTIFGMVLFMISGFPPSYMTLVGFLIAMIGSAWCSMLGLKGGSFRM